MNTSYVNDSVAFSSGLAYVADNGTVIMKGDDTTNLSYGEYRNRCALFRLIFDT